MLAWATLALQSLPTCSALHKCQEKVPLTVPSGRACTHLKSETNNHAIKTVYTGTRIVRIEPPTSERLQVRRVRLCICGHLVNSSSRTVVVTIGCLHRDDSFTLNVEGCSNREMIFFRSRLSSFNFGLADSIKSTSLHIDSSRWR